MNQSGNSPEEPQRVATENVLAYCFTLLGYLCCLEESIHKVETLREKGFPRDVDQFDTEIFQSLFLIKGALNANRDWDQEFSADPVAEPLALALQGIATDVVKNTRDPTIAWLVTSYSHDPSIPPTESIDPLFFFNSPNIIKRLDEILFRANLAALEAQARAMKLDIIRARTRNSVRNLPVVAIVEHTQKHEVVETEQPAVPTSAVEDSAVVVETTAAATSDSTSIDIPPAPPITNVRVRRDWEDHRSNETLTGWKAILHRVGMKNDRNNRRRVDGLNIIHHGPIFRPRTRSVYADAGALTWWWQSMAARAATIIDQPPSLPLVKLEEVGHYQHEEGLHTTRPKTMNDRDVTPGRPESG